MTRIAMEVGVSLLITARRWIFQRDAELQRLESEGLVEGAWRDVGDALRQATREYPIEQAEADHQEMMSNR